MKIYYDDTIIETLCGEKLPRSYELHASGLKIRFKSDGSAERKGFQLTYQSLGNYSNIIYRFSQV